MLMSGTRLLEVANKHNFALPAFNISDWAMCQGIFEICEAKGAPFIVAIHPDELQHTGVDLLPAIIQPRSFTAVDWFMIGRGWV